MATEEEICEKLSEVFKLFLKKDYYVVSTCYLDLLATHILKEVKNGHRRIFEIFQNWICEAIHVWNHDNKPCQTVITFAIKLVGDISTDEIIFLEYHKKYDIYNKLCSIFELEKVKLSASEKMAFTKMFLNVIEHKAGREWIIEKGIWKIVLKYAQQNHTIYLTRDSRIFLYTLLLKESNDKDIYQMVINEIVLPILAVSVEDDINSYAFKEVVIDQNQLFINTVELIVVILEKTMFENLENPIPEIFDGIESFESRVKAFFHACISTPHVSSLQKLSMLTLFIKLRTALRSCSVIDKNVFDKFILGLCYNASLLMPKKMILQLVIDSKLALLYFRKLKALKDFEIPKPQKFDNQAMSLMMCPLLATTRPFYGKDHYFFEEFINKICNLTSATLQRLGFNMRNLILQNPDLPVEHICATSIEHILEIVDLIEREAVIILFQTMCHVLTNFIPPEKSCCKKNMDTDATPTPRREPFHRSLLEGDPIVEKPILLRALLNGLIVITEKFHFKWQECVESICIMSITQDILDHTGVDPKICILILKLCKIATENFMQPNLALLVDMGPRYKRIGPALFKRLHDVNWEVQDSALEVLNTMVIVSEDKYIFYQKFLLDNKFLEVALDIVQTNSEVYLRASALVFLSSAVRINSLWDDSLSKMPLMDVALSLIQDDSEAIVRREAVKLVKEIFIRRNIESSVMKEVIRSMTIAAVVDLHWEVKINALEFWRRLIDFHFSTQGMVNGVFPDVTFSKKRRVIELTEREIIERLNSALDELADQGCLGVLLNALKDDSDFEVAKTAANIIGDLKKTLMKYKISIPIYENMNEEENKIDNNEALRTTEDNNSVACQKNYCEVIEDIISTNDTNILSTLYKESMDLDNGSNSEFKQKNFDFLTKIKRKDFLQSIFNFDFNSYLKSREVWLQTQPTSFESTLDDILTTYNKETNSMDCY